MGGPSPEQKPRFRIIHKGLLLILVPVLLQMGCILWLYVLIGNAERLSTDESTTFELGELCTSTQLEASSYFGKLMKTFIQGRKDPEASKYMQHLSELSSRFNLLLAKDQYVSAPMQREAIFRLQQSLVQLKEYVRDLDDIAAQDSSPFERIRLLKEMTPKTNRVVASLENLETYALAVEHERGSTKLAQAAVRNQMKNQIMWAVALEIIMTITVLLLLLNNITQRLNVLVNNARLIARGEPLAGAVSGADELSYLDQVLHKSSNSLLRAAEHKRALMQMVAHDLRSPMMSATLLTQKLISESKTKASELTPQLQELKQTCNLVIAFVEDLLTAEKLEAGKLELDWDSAELQEILRDSIQQLSGLAQAKQISIESRFEPIRVLCDRRRILQVFTNMLSNAIKYSPAGSAVIVTAEPEASKIRVCITDKGPGIPEGKKSKLFEKFFQADSGDSGEGFGLGLALCHLIICEHNGSIGADSKVGEGSTFWFTLPLDKEEDS
ncbi:MAG TPA: HAMP domain-containing sensor histidine kinase [Trichormus sp.]|jgi:signal transduction histidine kinase